MSFIGAIGMSFIGAIGPHHHGVDSVATYGVWTGWLSDVACNALQHASPLACLMAFYRLDHSHASSPWVQSAQHHASLHFALHPLLNDWVIETNVQLGTIGLLVQWKIRPL